MQLHNVSQGCQRPMPPFPLEVKYVRQQYFTERLKWPLAYLQTKPSCMSYGDYLQTVLHDVRWWQICTNTQNINYQHFSLSNSVTYDEAYSTARKVLSHRNNQQQLTISTVCKATVSQFTTSILFESVSARCK